MGSNRLGHRNIQAATAKSRTPGHKGRDLEGETKGQFPTSALIDLLVTMFMSYGNRYHPYNVISLLLLAPSLFIIIIPEIAFRCVPTRNGLFNMHYESLAP
jgi:hypothetical protein